ncbi:MAG: RluA family pseudouridine synthase [Clostridia bacterium]|nr:RluA family pseudouridine synthase [Clostridia bacterium]
MEIIVNEENSGKRLDSFVCEVCEKISRSLAQKLIDEERIKVNDASSKSSYKVKEKDVIFIPEDATKTSSKELKAEDIPIEIIYEDEDILVVNKPKGMVVHPGSGVEDGTLVNAVLGKHELSEGSEDFRPGIIHRLDKDTTGALVIAKNNYAHEKIAEQIKNRETKKVYVALVKGIIKEEKGVIDMPIGRSTTDRKKMAVIKTGKNAYTEFKVLKRFEEGYTLVEVNLKTGRTHQIRVHMAQIGHPVVGDSTYSSGKNPFGVTSQMLHSHILGFTHPTKNEYMEFEAPIPDYFNKVVKSLTKISIKK